MATTIQISENLHQRLANRKISSSESYEEVIWDLIEDTTEISEETKKEIDQARIEIEKGKGIPLEQLKKELRL